jgi:hypothetical protein
MESYTYRYLHKYKSCDSFDDDPIVKILRNRGLHIYDGDVVRTNANLFLQLSENDLPALYCVNTNKWISISSMISLISSPS